MDHRQLQTSRRGMYARKLSAIVLALAASLVATLAMATPAVAEGEPPVEDDGSDLIGRVEDQINDLETGSPGGGQPPPSCTWTDEDGEEHDNGELRWRLTMNDQDVWESDNPETERGTFYRYECWHSDMECGDPFWPGDDGCYGEQTEGPGTFCGSSVCEFDAINPTDLSMYALDEFIQQVPAPSPQFNPPNGRTIVNFDTWMWVEGIPGDGHISAPELSIPGITINTSADLNSIGWSMGDGGEFECPLTMTEADAKSECTYAYTRSSANQPNNTYTGQVSTVWEATWTAEPFGTSGTVEVPRETDFELQVAEVQ